MAKKYFAGNSLAAFIINGGSVSETTTSTFYDSTYNGSAVSLASTTSSIEVSQPFIEGDTSATTMWLRAELYSGGNNSTTIPYVLWLNGSTNAYRLMKGTASDTIRFDYWNSGTSAWVAIGSDVSLPAGARYTIAVKLVCATTVDVYIASMVTPVITGAVGANPQSQVTRVQFGAPINTHYWSQIMLADYDIRSHHYMSKLANANGTNTDGTGTFTDINETPLSDATSINLPAVGNHKSFTKAAITVPGGSVIDGMVVHARGLVAGGVVTDGKLLIRSGGTNYTSSAKSYSGVYSPRYNVWSTDPATSAQFTQTNFNNAEFGVEAA